MKKLLIGFRDYCYQELLIQKNQQHAEETYQLLFCISLYVYYAVFLTIVAIIQWQLRIPVPYIFKHNFFVVFVTGILMQMPFYLLIRWLLEKLSATPLQREMSHAQLITWRWKAFSFYGLGIASLCLIPWGLTKLLT